MEGSGLRTVLLAALALCAGAAASAHPARSERVSSGNLVMSLDARVSPLALPRHRAVPVTAALTSGIATLDRTPLPSVRRIEVEFGSGASISTAGLPTCPRARLLNATRVEARRRCGGALVGRGRLRLEARLPGQLPLRRAPRVLVFNGRAPGGGIALWLHAFVARPPIAFVLPFHLRRSAGFFATALTARVPPSVANWIHIRGFEVELGRRFRRHGVARSYLSATCPVPAPFTAGFFPLARTTYVLAGGRRVSNAIVRSCQVRS